ncbi:MAG: rhodanese-like domain-containing protein [Candidatus Caenarcaniphilales bacterium]|nr:rhodanese-like domain-containing protein [Candidatus Caenarcaniphilales bacterium]
MNLDNTTEVKNIEPLELKSLIDSNQKFFLVDVREKDEYSFCKINNSILCPLSDFIESIKSAKLDKKSRIILYCHHGKRSLKAANYLIEEGYDDIYNLMGGIDRWSLEVDDSVERY